MTNSTARRWFWRFLLGFGLAFAIAIVALMTQAMMCGNPGSVAH